MSEKYGFVYIWFDRKHKRYYIGAHWGTEDDGYICSSKWMKISYKRRPNDFKRRILFRCNNYLELWEKEYHFLKFIKNNELGSKYYNLWIGCYLDNHDIEGRRIISEKTKEKLRQINLGKKLSKETKIKITQSRIGGIGGMKGKTHTEETKSKMSDAHKNKQHTEESKLKMRGRIVSLETREKLRKKKGPMSEETKNKLRQAYFERKKIDIQY